LQGYGVWSVVSLIPSDDINPAAVDDRNRDLPQERVSMNASLDQSHRYTRVHTTSSNFSASSALPVIPCVQTIVQDKEQRASRERSHQSQKTGRNAPQGRYSCSICELDYAQPQGLARHQREKHKARLCMYCREFAWGRPYLFKEHLVKRHPGIDPNAVINEATRRSATSRRRYLPH
jgi:hypothetical protein